MPDRPSLSELFSNVNIERFSIAEILSIQQIASLPFNQHPLGFVRVLVSREDDYALRLHIWSDTNRYEQQPYWPIHNHKFDLISKVLAGSLTNRIYRVQQTSEKTAQQLYDVTYGIGSSKISQSGVYVDVENHHSEDVTAPSLYCIQAGTFHDTYVPIDLFTVTLVLTRDSLPDAEVKTVGDSHGPPSYEYTRSEVSDGEKALILTRLSRLF